MLNDWETSLNTVLGIGLILGLICVAIYHLPRWQRGLAQLLVALAVSVIAFISTSGLIR
jgi:hypothetical protein